MSRFAWWRAASLTVIGALAARAVWLAWQYYFNGGPRYRVESAMMALVIAGLVLAFIRRDETAVAETAPRSSPPIWWLPLFIGVALALYARALGLGFLSDDYTLRAMPEAGAGWFFRPLPLIVWRLLLAVFESPAVLHLVNVALHGVNAYLTTALGIAMGMRRTESVCAAALFVAFPALPEAVAWAAGIQDVLMTTMALGAVVVASREPRGGRQIAGVCVLLALGLLSKETAICIPALIALCWLWPSRLKRDAKLYAAIALVAMAYLAIRLPMGVGSDYFETPSRYFFKQLLVVAFGTLATPWRDPISLSARAQAFAAVVVLVLALVHAGVTWQRGEPRLQRTVRLSLWILASIAPVFTLFYVGPLLEGSRYLYLASAAWSLMVVDLIASASARLPRLRILEVVTAAAVLVFAISIQRELSVWRRAADVRDRVLTQARAAIDETGCTEPSFTNVPDSLEGAYVFRNGFREALRLPPPDTQPACTLAWTGERFVRSR